MPLTSSLIPSRLAYFPRNDGSAKTKAQYWLHSRPLSTGEDILYNSGGQRNENNNLDYC